MKRSKLTEARIAFALKLHEEDATAGEISRGEAPNPDFRITGGPGTG